MLLGANAHIGTSLIALYGGVPKLVTLLFSSKRDLATIGSVLECLMIKDPDAFLQEKVGSMFTSLAEDKALFFAELYFKTLIITAEQINFFFRELSMEQRTLIYNKQSNQFSELIKNAYNLRDILDFLPEQIDSVLELIEDKLQSVIGDEKGLTVALESLTAKQSLFVLDKECHLLDAIFDNRSFDTAIKLVEWLADIQDSELTDDQIKALLGEDALIRDLITLYGVPKLVTLLFSSTRDLATIGSVLECLMIQDLDAFLQEEVGAVFASLADEHAVLFAELYFKTLIVEVENVNSFFSALSMEQRTLIYNKQSNQFSELIKDACDLRDILDFLPEQIDSVLELIDHKLPTVITDSAGLTVVFQLLSEQQTDFVLNKMRDYLPLIIHDDLSFDSVINVITHGQCKLLIKSLVNTYNDCLNVFRYAHSDTYQLIIDSVKDYLDKLITDADQLVVILKFLDKEQCGVVIELLCEQLPKLFSNAEQLALSVRLLNERHCVHVIESCYERLITDSKHLLAVLELQSRTYRGLVINSVQGMLPKLISNADQLVAVLELLDKPEREMVINSVSEQWLDLITNAKQLAKVLVFLNKTERNLVLNSVQDSMPGLFINVEQVLELLNLLHEEQHFLVIQPIQEKLREVITDVGQLVEIIQTSSYMSRVLVTTSVLNKLPELLANADQADRADQLISVLECLDYFTAARGSVIRIVENMLPGLFTAADQLVAVLELLAETPEERELVLDAVQENLSSLLTDGEQLVAVLECLAEDSEERALVIETVQDLLPNLLTNADELVAVLEYFAEDSESRGFIIKCVRESLPNLFSNAEQLADVLSLLAEGECNLVIASVREQLPYLITDVEQLMLVLRALFDAQAAEILHSIANSSEFSKQLFAQERTYSVINAEQQVLDMLKQLGKKSLDLVRDDEIGKAIVALYLYTDVNQLFERYMQSEKSSSDFDAFYKQSAELIDYAKNSDLKLHSGWKEFFINLLIGIASLGLAFAVNKIVTGGRCSFFSVNTDSLNKVDELGDALQAMTATAS